MKWDKIDIMFPRGGIAIGNQYLNKNDILQLDKVETSLLHYARDMVTQEEKIVYYSNGNMDRYYVYNIYPPDQPENRSTLNDYGQKILNSVNGVQGRY